MFKGALLVKLMLGLRLTGPPLVYRFCGFGVSQLVSFQIRSVISWGDGHEVTVYNTVPRSTSQAHQPLRLFMRDSWQD